MSYGGYEFNDYQYFANLFASYPEDAKYGDVPVYSALGLLGEAGELANKLKKCIRDQGGTIAYEDLEAITAEMGDVLWYLAAIASDLEISLDRIARENIRKLEDRAARNKIGGSGDNR